MGIAATLGIAGLLALAASAHASKAPPLHDGLCTERFTDSAGVKFSPSLERVTVRNLPCAYGELSAAELGESGYELGEPHIAFEAGGAHWHFRWTCAFTSPPHASEKWQYAMRCRSGRASVSWTWWANDNRHCPNFTSGAVAEVSHVGTTLDEDCLGAERFVKAFDGVEVPYEEGTTAPALVSEGHWTFRYYHAEWACGALGNTNNPIDWSCAMVQQPGPAVYWTEYDFNPTFIPGSNYP
jgi:hypothetical protein